MKTWIIGVLAAVLLGVAAGTSGCFAKEPTLKGCSYDCSGGKPGARLYMSLSLNKDGTVRGVMETRRRHDEPTVRLEMMVPRVKFDELAAQAEFKKQLITIQKPKEKHPDCYPAKFGAEGKVRIKKSLGNKAYLWREDMALRKIIAAFGVDVSKFMFVAG